MADQDDFPDVEYVDQLAIDQEGVSRGLITQIFNQLAKQLGWKAGEGLPAILPDYGVSVSQAIGVIFSRALLKGQPVGHYFSPVLFKMIGSLKPEELAETMSDIPGSIFKKLAKILVSSLEHYKDIFNPGGNHQDWDSELDDLLKGKVSDRLRGLDIDKDFLKNIKPHVRSALVIAKTMEKRLSVRGKSWNTYSNEDTLNTCIGGILSADLVKKAFSIDSTSQIGSYLEQWIDAATTEDLQKLVYAISGSMALSPITKLSLNIDHGSDCDALPKMHTCALEMQVPPYSKYETFKSKLDQAINEVFSAGDFQLA